MSARDRPRKDKRGLVLRAPSMIGLLRHYYDMVEARRAFERAFPRYTVFGREAHRIDWQILMCERQLAALVWC